MTVRLIGKIIAIAWRTNRPLMVFRLTSVVASSLLPIAQLVVAQRLIDLIITHLTQPGGQIWPQVVTLVVLETSLYLINAILGRIDGMYEDAFHEHIRQTMTQIMLLKTRSLDAATFDDPDFYNDLQRVERDIYWRPNRIYYNLFNLLSATITLVASISLFLLLPVWIVLILILAAIPAFWVQTHYGEQSYVIDEEFREKHRFGSYYSTALTQRGAIKDIKLYGLEGLFFTRFTEIWDAYVARYYGVVQRFLWPQIGSVSLAFVARFGIFLWLAWATIGRVITVGQFTLYGGLIGQLASGLSTLLQSTAAIMSQIPFLRLLDQFLARQPVIKKPARPIALKTGQSVDICFENVSFRYPGQKNWALRRVTFTLKAGGRLALVGENGAGKTTLVKLLVRFYDPTEGRIVLNNRDLREYRLEDLHRAIGVIFQDFAQFQAAVHENIGFGHLPRLKRRQLIRRAATISGADPFIRQLPEDYETLLALEFAGGVELSGGQWQKIALARAFFRNAQLLVLDEPTAALDPAAEEHFYKQFLRLQKNTSAILISHRFSTVRMADQILVLEKGRVAEYGSHAKLMQQAGRYAKLFRLQAARYQ